MSDDWTPQQLTEIRRLAPDYGWQDKDGDVMRWINTRAPECLAEYKRQAEEAKNATYEAGSNEAQATEQPKWALYPLD